MRTIVIKNMKVTHVVQQAIICKVVAADSSPQLIPRCMLLALIINSIVSLCLSPFFTSRKQGNHKHTQVTERENTSYCKNASLTEPAMLNSCSYTRVPILLSRSKSIHSMAIRVSMNHGDNITRCKMPSRRRNYASGVRHHFAAVLRNYAAGIPVTVYYSPGIHIITFHTPNHQGCGMRGAMATEHLT